MTIFKKLPVTLLVAFSFSVSLCFAQAAPQTSAPANGQQASGFSLSTEEMNRPYSVFHAVVGLDDESACGDGVHFIVLADGREVYHSERLYSTQKKSIDVDISGASRLELRIDMGDEKNCDHGDWANAWLEAK